MRDLAPAELRYQSLDAGPGKLPWVVGGVTGGVALGGVVGTSIALGFPVFAAFGPVVGAVAALFAGFLTGPFERGLDSLVAVPVAVVPWGIVIDPDKVPEPIPWSEIKALSHRIVTSNSRHDKHAPRRALFLFNLGDRRIQAVADEGPWVTAIHTFRPKLAVSASRSFAPDLAGTSEIDRQGLPLSLALVRRAQALLDSPEAGTLLGLEGGGYRTTSSRIAGERTRQILHAAFWDSHSPHDPGPLAVILAGELRVTSLLPHLLELILAPSPLLAAVARAAAVRLGATLISAGSLDEIRDFLPEADIAELRNWMEPRP